MTIAFFTNFISHHQVYVADELYKLTGEKYYYVEMEPMPDSYQKAGYPDCSDRPYVVQAWKSKEAKEKAEKIAIEVDVMLIGSLIALPYEVLRCKKNGGITFEISERWFKKGLKNVLSPHFLKWYYYYLTTFRNRDVYKLCCSAFTSYDMSRIGAFENKCYKWAYFTKVDEYEVQNKEFTGARIMWVSRLIDWKHPELCIELARLLKKEDYQFSIDIYGDGLLKTYLQKLCDEYDVSDYVVFRGNSPNSEIVEAMRNHDIVLATSDQNEGWGAVVNEAMSNGCVLIGSHATGSVPYLIKDGINGFVFKSGDLASLYSNVIQVLGNASLCKQIAVEAYRTMRDIWSPRNGARSLIKLIDDIMNKREPSISEGPCSKAEIIKL